MTWTGLSELVLGRGPTGLVEEVFVDTSLQIYFTPRPPARQTAKSNEEV